MNLDNHDLQAIRAIVTEIVDEAIEESDQRTAAGFLAVDEQLREIRSDISELKATTARTERILQAEIERNDHQDLAIGRIRKNLHAV